MNNSVAQSGESFHFDSLQQCKCYVHVERKAFLVDIKWRLNGKSKNIFPPQQSISLTAAVLLEPEISSWAGARESRKYLSITQTIQCRIFEMNKSMNVCVEKEEKRSTPSSELWEFQLSLSLWLTNSKMSNNLTFFLTVACFWLLHNLIYVKAHLLLRLLSWPLSSLTRTHKPDPGDGRGPSVDWLTE